MSYLGYALGAIAFLLLGFLAGREYTRMQMDREIIDANRATEKAREQVNQYYAEAQRLRAALGKGRPQ